MVLFYIVFSIKMEFKGKSCCWQSSLQEESRYALSRAATTTFCWDVCFILLFVVPCLNTWFWCKVIMCPFQLSVIFCHVYLLSFCNLWVIYQLCSFYLRNSVSSCIQFKNQIKGKSDSYISTVNLCFLVLFKCSNYLTAVMSSVKNRA